MAKCRSCSYCKQIGRQNSNRDTYGRKRYWCEHSLINLLDDKVFGNKSPGFICFGENNIKSPLTIKTSPRWCPLRKYNVI